MQNSPSISDWPGAVEVRGRTWRLVDTRRFERCSLITLRGLERGNAGETLRVLSPFDRLSIPRRRARLRTAGRIAVARRVADAVIGSHGWQACWTAAAANIELLPWQLEPALTVLDGATRVLLADAVGLGKTVQAGLILAELSARGLIDRTLILTPAGLRAQWAGELATRFGLEASVLDQPALAREAARLPPDATPWAASSIVISSIDLVKRAETLMAVDRLPFDVLIVDEAHHVTPDSDRGAVVARIARRTPWVVLISATPHSGDERAFRFLCDIGGPTAPVRPAPSETSGPSSTDADGQDRLTIFRRHANQHERRARTRLVPVRPSPAEALLLEGIQAYAKAIWSGRGVTSPAARLVAILLARRAASSADAVLASLLRRRALLVEDGAAPPTEQASFAWEELDARDGDEADHVLAAPGLSSIDDEGDELDRVIELAQRARESATKASWIRRFLTRAREPAIVFSEYRDTIEALHAQFETSLPVVMLHGGLSPAMRRNATSAFVDGDAMLLLATDAGGEGLNLQARCRTVINVELPWNPLRLEQRVGRVDRLGQRRRVHAMHLLHAGSVEETVLSYLYRRVAKAAAAAPADAMHGDVDTRVAEAILSGSPSLSLTLPEWPTASVSGSVEEAERLRTLRALTASAIQSWSPAAGADALISVPRRAAPAATSIICAFQVTARDGLGRIVASAIVPVAIALPSPLPSARRELLSVVQLTVAHQTTLDLVTSVASGLLQASRRTTQDLSQAVHARVTVLAEGLSTEGDILYQPALFDDRSTRVTEERATVHAIHRRHLESVSEAMRHFEPLTVHPPAFIGGWLS